MSIIQLENRPQNNRGRQNKPQNSSSRAGAFFAFITIWLVIFILIIANFQTLKKIFLTENPYFTLEDFTTEIQGPLTSNQQLIALTDTFLEKQRTDLGETPLTIFNFDAQQLKQLLETNLSTIEKAEINLIYPDRFHIRVSDFIPYALLEYNRTSYILNRDGVVMQSGQTNLPLLPTIVLSNNSELELGLGKVIKQTDVHKALKILRMVAVARKGRYFDIKKIIFTSDNLIKLFLRKRGLVAESCMVILDANHIEVGLAGAAEIIATRSRQGLTSTWIDPSTLGPDSLRGFGK